MTDGSNSKLSARNPRMIDVAKLAGVSHQTVSRVLNASPAVGPELTLRVNEAIQLLGYKRNPAARALASRRSMNLGVISFGISLYGPSLTLFGITDEAQKVGYTTSLVSLADFTRSTVQDAFEHLEEMSVDGVIVIAPVRDTMEIIRGLSDGIPLVTFAPGLEDPGSISLDEVGGARLATRHLLELGHETVWHVSGPEGWLGTDARVKGWRQELAAGRRVAHEVLQAKNWSALAGYRIGQQIAGNAEITALFVANDQMSLGVLRALHEAGRRVPEDISLVGFDDIPEADFFLPGLTTIRLDFDATGRGCVAMLLEQIRGRPASRPSLPPPTLVIRSSTGAPRPG